MDILVTTNNGPAHLLLNTVPNRGHWLLVHLEGAENQSVRHTEAWWNWCGRDGTSVKSWVRGDGSYLAANDPRVHFGLGKDTAVDRIQVHWLAGECEAWKQAAVDTDCESAAKARASPARRWRPVRVAKYACG